MKTNKNILYPKALETLWYKTYFYIRLNYVNKEFKIKLRQNGGNLGLKCRSEKRNRVKFIQY